jgi:hypothetical protein
MVMSKPSRRCSICKTEASDPTQTLCTKCQSSLPVYFPDRGKCLCCGHALGDPVWIGGSGLTGTGTAFVGNQTVTMSVGGGHHDFSCTQCGDPEPKAYSRCTSLGGVLVGIQVLLYGIGLSVWLSQTQGPWHLSGPKATLVGLGSVLVLGVWSGMNAWGRPLVWLAPLLFPLLAFWPLYIPAPTEIPVDLVPGFRIKALAVALPLNLVAFALLLKMRRKPFASW